MKKGYVSNVYQKQYDLLKHQWEKSTFFKAYNDLMFSNVTFFNNESFD